MMTRKKPTSVTETEVLTRSRRRCCICFGLHRDVEVKAGQIVHLDGDNSNSAVDNLAFLCLQHHDQYDSMTSQSKNLTLPEVKSYREELHKNVLSVIESQHARLPQPPSPPPASASFSFDAHRKQELKDIVVEVLSDMAGPLRSLTHLAHRLSLAKATVERLLFELAEERTVRIDRSRGSTRKTYSLVAAPENRLLDTFVSQFDTDLASDDRFIQCKNHELDAIIRTKTGAVYAVETMCALVRLSRSDAATRIQRLLIAKRELGVAGAMGVLLIGITPRTRGFEENLKDLEGPDLMIRYVEMD